MVTAPRRMASLARRVRRWVSSSPHLELVVQVDEVLLDRRLAHDQLGGDLSDGGRLGEEVAGEQRPAQHDEHVALPRRERRRRRPRSRSAMRPTSAELRNSRRDRPTRISSPCRSRCCRPDPLAVHEGAVRRAEVGHAPALGELLERRRAGGSPSGRRARCRCRRPCRRSPGRRPARLAARRQAPRSRPWPASIAPSVETRPLLRSAHRRG